MFYTFFDSLDDWLTFCSSARSHFMRTKRFTSTHLETRRPSQQMAIRPTLVAASCTGFRPAVLHIEMETVSIVFNSIYNPVVKRREAGVNVTVEFFVFVLIVTTARWQAGNESCRWQRNALVQARGEESNLEGQTPELSEPALNHTALTG